MKKRLISSIACGSMLLMLGACGSKEEAKDTTPQSAESTEKSSSSKEIKDTPCTEATPFNQGKPVYVISNDDENMNVNAIVNPYLDTKDKVKVETYEDGDLEKTYIVEYKVEKIQKGDKKHIPIYKYTFYENDSDEIHEYVVTLSNRKDLGNELFIWLYPLDKGEKIPSEEKIKELVANHWGSLMTDESDVVTLK